MVWIGSDVPAPLSPASAVTRPGSTSRSIRVSARTGPNVFETPRSRRSAVPSAGTPFPPSRVVTVPPVLIVPSRAGGPPARREGPVDQLLRHRRDQLIPAALHPAAAVPEHSCVVGTKLSFTTVSFMLSGVTQIGFSRTEGTETFAFVSWVDPLTRPD